MPQSEQRRLVRTVHSALDLVGARSGDPARNLQLRGHAVRDYHLEADAERAGPLG